MKNFNLTPENIGGLFKSHLSNIVDSQIPVPEGDYQQQSQLPKKRTIFDQYILRQKKYSQNMKKRVEAESITIDE